MIPKDSQKMESSKGSRPRIELGSLPHPNPVPYVAKLHQAY